MSDGAVATTHANRGVIPPTVHDTATAQTEPVAVKDRHAQATLQGHLEQWSIYLAAVLNGIRCKPCTRAGQLAQGHVSLKRSILGMVCLEVL
jgi:hypothetical protein